MHKYNSFLKKYIPWKHDCYVQLAKIICLQLTTLYALTQTILGGDNNNNKVLNDYMYKYNS